MAESSQSTPPSRLAQGLLLYTLGLLVLATLDTLTKVLTVSHHYPVPVVAWARYTLQLFLLLAVVTPRMGTQVFRPSRPFPVLVRSLSLVFATLFLGLALQRMPLAESIALVFTAPLMVVVLAARFLKEPISLLQVLLALVGFVGVVLIARPTGNLDLLGVLFALLCAVSTAVYQLLSRSLSQEGPVKLLVHSAWVGSLIFGVMALFNWGGSPLTPTTLMLFLGLGLCAGLGHFLFTLGFQFAPASIMAPLSYLQLLFEGIFGFLVFHHLPDALALTGMGVITLSGVGMAVLGQRAGKWRGKSP
ncbi:DMT family transporter [Deinococcus roseus]|uniref:Membrane protein n=1 Tax=Deinococcus roseus TaxID=392414 RepID=A0ABQ2DGN8_9DEIO|nr:DMT family transporter [Deinococcus roseus]GGJ57446.1 membrane protein [Deinococcus roseus]